jgi:hypothetical protein
MAGALDRTAVSSELLKLRRPVRVGYAVAVFTPKGEDESRAFDVKYQQGGARRIGALREGETPLRVLRATRWRPM